MKILAIETSFDDTSIAILDDENVIAMKTYSQAEKHLKFGGIVPELASRIHSQSIFSLINLTCEDANIKLKNIDKIAVTIGPGLVNTLQVGLIVAKTLSFSLSIPYYGINHLQAHVYSPFINKDCNEIPKKAIILLVSGGHTILAIKRHKNIKIVGETMDDAVGEAFDKVAKLLGLGFPGGPIIDEISKDKRIKTAELPIPNLPKYNFSYSGLKSFVLNQKNKIDVNELVKGFQFSAIKQLINKLKKLQEETKIMNIIVGGGVAANSLLKEEINKLEGNKYISKSIYATDNAAMIGYTAYYLIKNNLKSLKNNVDVIPRMKLDRN